MQTFLPFPDYKKSAQALDPIRLRNQRRESLSLITSIINNNGWINHPCAKMWKPYLYQLCVYSCEISIECITRGFKDNCLNKFISIINLFQQNRFWYKIDEINYVCGPKDYPHWLGNEVFHESHQSNLLRKDYSYYKDKFPGIVPYLNYYWPI